MAPPTRRTAISIHKLVARAVAKKFNASPQKPSNSTRLRPQASERAPNSGAPKKLAMPKAKLTTPTQ